MKGNEFLRKVRKFAAKTGNSVRYDPKHGKGSHGTLHLGSRRTTLKDLKKELPAGLVEAMCDQLGIRKRDLEG